jgi:NAD(P)-dependent dehydrogenase (short-subunit alcohol dehydrogenase family)
MTAEHRSLAGRVVIITGAGQGIGRAYALAFAQEGAIPIVADLSRERAESVAAEVRAIGAKTLAIEVDVGVPGSVNAMAEAALAAFGRIDVLVNNAGVYAKRVPPETRMIKRPFDEIPLDEWEMFLRVNITGSYLCARAVVPTMRKAKYGRIINTGSSTMLLGIPGQLHYVTSKAAIIGMTRSLARELGTEGITVNTLVPGLIQTEIDNPAAATARVLSAQCIPRSETPADLVPAVLFLASEGARFITGQSINVDGGSAFI